VAERTVTRRAKHHPMQGTCLILGRNNRSIRPAASGRGSYRQVPTTATGAQSEQKSRLDTSAHREHAVKSFQLPVYGSDPGDEDTVSITAPLRRFVLQLQ